MCLVMCAGIYDRSCLVCTIVKNTITELQGHIKSVFVSIDQELVASKKKWSYTIAAAEETLETTSRSV